MKDLLKSDYVDEIYNFEGQWGLPSICGLKVVQEENLAILTELYDENPGTSVADFCLNLAEEICEKFHLDPEELIFVEHTPDKQSKLSFNNESFFRVVLKYSEKGFEEQDWQEMKKEEVDKLIQSNN